MTIMLGGREIQVLHAQAITPGDTYLYLPKEKILVTGDILLSPYPFAIGGTYPAEWLRTLEKFAVLEPTVIIPGHGDAETNTDFLHSNIALFQEVMQQVKDDKAKGMTVEQTVEALGQTKRRVGGENRDQRRRNGRCVQRLFPGCFRETSVSRTGWPAGRLAGWATIPSVKRGNPIV